jgi:hypothetical protein
MKKLANFISQRCILIFNFGEMKSIAIVFLVFSLTITSLMLISGCEKKIRDSSTEIEKWESLGWKYHEAVGDKTIGGVYLSAEMIDNPGSIVAFSTTNMGRLESKDYKAIKGRILVVHMGREGKGCYSLIFIK